MMILSRHAVHKPKIWFWLSGIISIFLVVLVLAPTLSSRIGEFLHPLKIDADPENMLSSDEPVRVFHNAMKKQFGLYDIIVVGVMNESNPKGVFNTSSLKDIHELTEYAKTLNWQGEGVVSADIIAPSTVDNIEQGGLGSVRFEWLMRNPPVTEEEAAGIARKAANIPLLRNTLVSDDNKALAIYIPITSKNISYEVAEKLRKKTNTFQNNDAYHITGLPVAQDQFGVEMFKQMAVSAPLAMLLIFLLMWWFFRHIKLVIAPMIVAIISVIFTMGLLVVTGNTVHIMSSMIPIFIMPIAVLDAVHILSDFFDKYPKTKDRYKTIMCVMEELSKPMFYTTLTTCAGFGSLAFTPIPPVQTFGVFVALGVFFAWILTVTLVPAYIMLMSEKSLEGFGLPHGKDDTGSLLAKFLRKTGQFTYHKAKFVVFTAIILGCVAYYGITKIQINDNPVKWFAESHDIRIADKALNEKFAGTYMAYLSFSPKSKDSVNDIRLKILSAMTRFDESIAKSLEEFLIAQDNNIIESALNFILDKQNSTETDEEWEVWDNASILIDSLKQERQIFTQPEMLRYIEKLQNYLLQTGLVGKSNALPDVVKTVHRELFLGKEEHFRIPESSAAVVQTLMTYQSSHKPQDLWHFVTPDYRNSNLWIQLKSGDNKDMNAVVLEVAKFLKENPSPIAINAKWFGLTYINTVWQDKMVSGMLDAFVGSFIIVLVMMVVLFRSLVWGVLCMIPLAVTISFIYGIIGLIGKDYDMPVAVLSSLSLGLAVDYSIHFLTRSRQMYQGKWQDTIKNVFGEPARAITRNVIVIGVGFMPLLAAPLMPYKTVGVFISAILLFAGAATIFLLPALITIGKKGIFKEKN
jgi:predicted RND superfamily exporter protein